MNLDDLERIRQIDAGNMLDQIEHLPDQLQQAWELGINFDLPQMKGIERVVIVGMGGSAIGGDLVAAYAARESRVPISIWRNYDLPAFAEGNNTLVILSSHSGNTEETLSGLEAGVQAGAQLLAICTGGELAKRVAEEGIPIWQFEHVGQPRAAVGFSAGLLLTAFFRLGLLPDPIDELQNAISAMREQQSTLTASVPVVHNPAKRLAGQFMERWPVFLAADLLAPVARRWRTQISELAKSVAQFEELPEADHNMVAGVIEPQQLFSRAMVVFLRSTFNHPRNQLRLRATREVLMVEGFNTDAVEAVGETRLAHQWTSLHFGDYVAFYLASAYGVDPTPVEAIESLKRKLREG